MSIYIKTIKYEKLSQMNREGLFEIATARAGGFKVARFDIDIDKEIPERTQKLLKTLARILRGAKKRSAIQFFVTEDGFLNSTTESNYLLNVYPEIEEHIPTDRGFIFVKL